MERKNIIISLVVVALVLGFITELFYFGGSFKLPSLGSGASAPQNVTGTTMFNGTIRTYNPILEIPANTSQSVIDKLRTMQGVKDIKTQANFDIIETETRDDVYPIAVSLRQMNVSGVLTAANIAVPQDLEVVTDNGTVNVSTLNLNGIVQVVTEPFVDSGSEVPVYLTVVMQDGVVIDYYGARIMAERNSVTVNATVAELANMTFTYTIPWDGRASMDLAMLNRSGSSYGYKEVNTILFSPQLKVTDVLAKKQLPYITFIDPASAEAAANFSDEAAVRKDFAATNVTFPVSTLVVTARKFPDLGNYTPAVRYSYIIGLPESAGGYSLGNATSFTMETVSPLDVNSTVPMNVTILAIGPSVLSVTPQPLP